MYLDREMIKAFANKLYLLALGLYVVSFLARTVLLGASYLSVMADYGGVLGNVAPLLATELAGLISPLLAGVCLLLAVCLRPLLLSVMDAHTPDEPEAE